MTWIYFLFIAVFFSCTDQDDNKFSDNNVIEVYVNPAITFQEIHNFGASDAWSCQVVGNWPDEKKNRIADLLFSLETNEDGSPKGIGLSCWRFNIGAGSARQGEDSGIGDPWRRAGSFLQPDGSYNWDKQSGQRWFSGLPNNEGLNRSSGL